MWLALDVGGANLKASDGDAFNVSRPFPLWRQPEELPAALAAIVDEAPPCERIALTMTGELADCYATRAGGVKRIVAATLRAAGNRPVVVYQTDGQLVEPDKLLATDPLLAAASNWHALASFAARFCGDDAGLLIDVGSTTIDVIPIVKGKAAARGSTDVERLLHGELVYTGVERSPVCAVVGALPYRGLDVPVAQEVFATTVDAYLLLGEIGEDASDCNTADGRPRTREAARQRLGRTLCTEFTSAEAATAATAIREAQLAQLRRAYDQVAAATSKPPQRIILSGHGEFLLRPFFRSMETSKLEFISLSAQLDFAAARCATAFASAVLARERLGP